MGVVLSRAEERKKREEENEGRTGIRNIKRQLYITEKNIKRKKTF